MSIGYCVDGDVIRATVVGHSTRREMEALLLAVAAYHKESKEMSLLIDARDSLRKASPDDIHQGAEFLASLRPPFGSRCAIVVSDETRASQSALFAEHARSFGIHVAVFREPEPAQRWLRQIEDS